MVVSLMIVYKNNPSSPLPVEIKMIYNAYAYLVKYIRKIYAHFKDKLQPCSPSHESLSYYISKKSDKFVEETIIAPHVEDISHEVSISLFHEDNGNVSYSYFQIFILTM